jgi:hypothetical protein
MSKRILLLVGLLGCEDVDSGDVLTSGMWGDIAFTADGTGASQASAFLRVGGVASNTYVDLQGDDQLTATLLDAWKPMVEEELGEIHRYVASFDTAPVGEPVVVAFVRTVDAGAPQTIAELPPEFALDPPVATFSRNTEDLVLSWTPTSTQMMRVEISGDCVWPFVDNVPDAGSYTLVAGTLDPLDDAAPISCALDVAVRRLEPGTIDPGYGQGGTAVGVQLRTTEIGSTP